MNSKTKLDSECRIGLKINPDVKQWFVEKADSYNMSMAAYMQFVLVQHYEQQQNSKALRDLSEVGKSEDTKAIYAMLEKILENQEKEGKKA